MEQLDQYVWVVIFRQKALQKSQKRKLASWYYGLKDVCIPYIWMSQVCRGSFLGFKMWFKADMPIWMKTYVNGFRIQAGIREMSVDLKLPEKEIIKLLDEQEHKRLIKEQFRTLW